MVLNPAELHRECVRLEHQNHLLEKKLAAKDSELLASCAQIDKLEQMRESLRSDAERLQKEVGLKGRDLTDQQRMCQQLIQEREEWRGREVAMHRKMEALHLRLRETDADGSELEERVEKMQRTIREQDQQIQDHLTKRQQILRRMDCPVAAAGCQTETLLDDQSQRIIAAESVATVGINEARAIKVECQQLKRKLSRLEASNTRANEACAAYKGGCETLQEEIEHLSKEVSTVRQDHQADRQQLLTQLRASEQRERDLHSSMNAIRSRDVSVEEARKEVERLGSRDIELLRTENQQLKDEARAMIEASLEIREQKEKYQERYVALMKTLQQVREQADEHRRLASEDIQALNRENAEIFDDYNRIRKERQEIRQQLTDAEKRVKSLIDEKLARRAPSCPKADVALSTSLSPERLEGDVAEAAEAAAAAAAVREARLEGELSAQQAEVGRLSQQVSGLTRELKESKQRLQNSDTAGAGLTKMLEQENERLREDLRSQRHHEEGDGTLLKLVENLERDNTFLRGELESRAAQRRSPGLESPAGATSMNETYQTYMTRLQALASQPQLGLDGPFPASTAGAAAGGGGGGGGGGGAAVGAGGSPAEERGGVAPGGGGDQAQTIANMQQVLLVWGSCLNKLVKKSAQTLKNADTLRRYLTENSAGGVADPEGLPIFKQEKYPNEAWNKVFEALAGIRYCISDAETKSMGVIARGVVFEKKLSQMIGAVHGGEQPQQPRPHHPAPPPLPPGVEQQSVSQQMPSSHLSQHPLQQPPSPPATHAGVDPYEMIDHSADTDSTDSEVPGEDLDHCTQLIYDTDALLRASQGADMFWGDQRLEYLKTELRKLQDGGIDDLSSILDPSVGAQQQQQQQHLPQPQPHHVAHPQHSAAGVPGAEPPIRVHAPAPLPPRAVSLEDPPSRSASPVPLASSQPKRYVSSQKTMRWADPSTSSSLMM